MSRQRTGESDRYVTRILRRVCQGLPDLSQQDLADALQVDRSHISHQLAGRFRVSADELAIWCDHLGTIEPLQAIARRLNYRLVPIEQRRASPQRFLDGFNELLRDSGLAGYTAGTALADGVLVEAERIDLHRQLETLIETAEALQAALGVAHAAE